jgi:rod shape-determining protein MreC
MSDEKVQAGEALVTSGGDRVFPKGLPIGTVANVSVGRNLFLDIKLKPAADLDRLEEVLVITEQKLRAPDTTGLGPIRASDILAEHLPGVPQAPADVVPPSAPSAANGQPAPAASAPPQGVPQKAVAPKPQSTAAPAGAVVRSAAVKPTSGGANIGKQPAVKLAATGAGANAAKSAAVKSAATGAKAAKSQAAKPTAPKAAAPRAASPNASGSKPRTAPGEGTGSR